MRNAEDIVRRCIACQKFASRPHAPASELKTILLSWSFATWGLDMVGPLKKSSKGGRTHLLVAVDKSTKWIEAVPINSSSALTTVILDRRYPRSCDFTQSTRGLEHKLPPKRRYPRSCDFI